MNFTISKDCPAKYLDENRYITSWEKKMIKFINEQIDEELEALRKEQNPVVNGRKRLVIVTPIALLDPKRFREKRIDEIEEAYRKNYTLKKLEKCGLNIEEFNKTWMGSCSRNYMLLSCVQDKIDGFDYDDDGARIPNHKKMNTKNMIVTYENDVLKITDGNNTYEFKVDEHELIYVNDENVFASSLNPIPTKEEEYEELRRLHEDMEADRIRNERATQKSLDFAKTFWVK